MENEKEIKIADLFGGVGGFRLGIERAINNKFNTSTFNKDEGIKSNIASSDGGWRRTYSNVRCVFYSDIDKYAVQTYNKNFGETYEATDIRTIKADSIPDIDMLCGGFPCQAFSIAGKRKGFNDTRGTLFFEIARIVKAKRPKIVFLENVKGLLNHEKGQTFSIILNTLWELGYDVQWMVLNSKFFGVPQNRERIFIIGNLRGTGRSEILPFGESYEKDGIEIRRIGHMKRFRRYNQTYDISGGCEALDTSQGGGHQPCVMTQVHNMQPRSPNRPSLKYSSGGSGHLQRDDISYCLDGGNTNAVEFSNMKIRRLTPTECERLQSFPDGWTEGVSDTQRYKQMGNAVTVNVIEAIAARLLENDNRR